ncbi:MAG: acetyl ornithine aminotransferase family protein [Thermoprotei archaeon]
MKYMSNEDKGPRIIVEPPGPKATEIIKADEKHIMQSFSRWYPLVADRGEGSYIYDVDGNKYLDFNAGIAVMALGHANKSTLKAVTEQAQKLLHYSFTDFLYEPAIKLSEKLVKISPQGPDTKVFFANSGAEANEAMIKAARWTTKRQYVLAFTGSFHGRTLGALSLTASKQVQRRYFGPLLPSVEHVPFPYCYRCPFKLEPNSCDLYCVDYIQEQTFKYTSPEEIALFVVEAIQGEGGYVPAPEAYFSKLKKLLDKHGILLGVDEVQSGMGRTGKWFAIEHYNVKPDYVSLAKALGGGLPLGALIGREELMELDPGSHASTFGGNPVSCAAGLSVIEEIEKRNILYDVERKGEYVVSRLREMQTKYPLIGDVRGKGLMIGAELVKDSKTKKPAKEELQRIIVGSWKRGLVVIGAGESTIRICPPLTISQEELDIGLNILEDQIKLVVQN